MLGLRHMGADWLMHDAEKAALCDKELTHSLQECEHQLQPMQQQ